MMVSRQSRIIGGNLRDGCGTIDAGSACRFDPLCRGFGAQGDGREGMRIRAPKDFWAGVMFGGFAVVALLAARGYSVGTAGKMGPGYFPLLLGGLLGVLAALLIGRSIVLDGEPLPRFQVLPIAVIAVAVCLFGFFIEPFGLIVALAVLTVLSAWAGPQFRLPEALALTVALIVFSVGVFVYALGLPIPIWPSGWPSNWPSM